MTFQEAWLAIVDNTMSDADFKRKMNDPLFRAWVKYKIKRADENGNRGTVES